MSYRSAGAKARGYVELDGNSLRNRRRSAAGAHVLRERFPTCLEIIVLAHLGAQLPLNPVPDPRLTTLVHPSALDDGPDNPLLLALLPENVAEPSVVRQPPYGKVHEEEVPRDVERKEGEEDDLKREEGEGEDIDVRLWKTRVEEGGEHVVSLRDTKDCRRGQSVSCGTRRSCKTGPPQIGRAHV